MNNPIEYLKGVGPLRADLLKKELEIFTFEDLLMHFPYRHLDRTKIQSIASLDASMDYAQVRGIIVSMEVVGERRAKRLVVHLRDTTGIVEMTWFQGINWMQKTLALGNEYLVFGRLGFFLGRPQLNHPEVESLRESNATGKSFLEPIYPVTEKLKARGLNAKALAKLVQQLFLVIEQKDIPECLPADTIKRHSLISRWQSLRWIHFPEQSVQFDQAVQRIKFEELFVSQLRLGQLRSARSRFSKGSVFSKVGGAFNRFYHERLPYELTGAQKRVLKEIRTDLGSGRQMNRLLQGDVGSGKTIVALMSMLIALDNGFQSCIMAPTEILAKQHADNFRELVSPLEIEVGLLAGSTRSQERKKILEKIEDGSLGIVVGTHALIEDAVKFHRLGFAVVDEQHKFGVAQRAKLWEKSAVPPHMLVMTATPIPRTLAMTAYGDLDYSVIDELPPGRTPVHTVHRLDDARPQVMEFIRAEIEAGRQAYFIFPLIEESEKLQYEDLMRGYENVKAWFPEPKYWISMVHGRMNTEQKDINMRRFVERDTQIMVSTTVIEVGVNVPNATVMVIESAEKFGLSQLHQLRGRVGRGSEKSYCILLSANGVGKEAKERLSVMCTTNDGFRIAEKDLEIRGPGDIQGTRQSGALEFRLADIVADKAVLEKVKREADRLLSVDPDLILPEHSPLSQFLRDSLRIHPWAKIS
ncbi:MAG: ATP-dependent DNA helicase RecG [Bacteroidetes bacterium]|nr:ATP-dependent DNA helicase RecG [Bacteroidota bacterium]